MDLDYNKRRDLFSGKIKPKFGNLEHIKAIQGAEYRRTKLSEGMILDIDN